jgi:hypothetical protein
VIWHRATTPELDALRVDFVPWMQGEGITLRTDFHPGCTRLVAGSNPAKPDVEIGLNRRFFEQDFALADCYDPGARTSPLRGLACGLFHVHDAGVPDDAVQRWFMELVRRTPKVLYAAYETAALKGLWGPEFTRPLPADDRGVERDVVAGPALVRVFSDRLARDLRLEERLAPLQGATLRRAHDRVVMALRPDFDAQDPAHRREAVARFERVPAFRRPRSEPGAREEHRAERRLAWADAQRVGASLVGQVVDRVRVLELRHDGAPVSAGQGPVELHLGSGRVVHTWPQRSWLDLRDGPLPEHAAQWAEPDGVTTALQVVDVDWRAPGPIQGVWLGVSGCFDELSPFSWELGFGGVTLRSLQPTTGLVELHVDRPRPVPNPDSSMRREWHPVGVATG